MESAARTRLGIIFGGRSGEHEVSVTSAASVIEALDPNEFEIFAIGIKKSGELAAASEVLKMLPNSVQGRFVPRGFLESGESKLRLTSGASKEAPGDHPAPEIVFPLLHGPYGEDGTMQGLLEIAGVPYIGCGVLASAVGMDKDFMKRLFLQAGLPVLPWRVLPSRDALADLSALKNLVRKEFGYPVFSKPVSLGSSVGVRKIHDEGELEEAIRLTAQFDRKVLIEKGIDARELECGVLGNDDAEASVVGEIFPSREFYDYDAKYVNPSRLEIPACIEESKSREIRDLALRAFHAIDGSGLSRADFFAERPTGKIWINEINTMPGFTPISMYSKVWAATGVCFEELVRRLIRLGLERYQERRGMRISA